MLSPFRAVAAPDDDDGDEDAPNNSANASPPASDGLVAGLGAP